MRTFTALAVSVSLLALSGCSAISNFTSTSTTPGPSSGSGATIHGVVHGGQNPVNGGHVYFYAVGNTGYGGQAVSLLTSGTKDAGGNYYVTTDSTGSFSLTGKYTCPVANAYPVTYVLAFGGDSGSGNNSAIALIAPLGDCTKANFTSVSVTVNEVSTVATMYGASAFITDLTHVSYPSTALAQKALNNTNLYNLYDGITGVAASTTSGGNGTPPTAELNTLANIIAACVNSNGAVTGPTNPTPCYTLFSNALSGGTTGTMPSDTATAALNIARNPWANMANLFALQTANSPFQPDLSAAPNDFTIAITFTGGGLASPGGIAIDANNTVWIANNSAQSISEFGSDGTAFSSSTGITGGGLAAPFGIAIDANGYVWTGNPGAIAGNPCNCVSEFNPSTNLWLSGSSGFTGGGLTKPQGIAIDPSGHVWVSNPSANSISELNSSNGSVVSGSPITTGGLSTPLHIVIDSSGNVWVGNNVAGGTLSIFNSSGVANASAPFGSGNLNMPRGMAVDASDNIWIASRGNSVLGEFNASGAVSSTGYINGGINTPNYTAVDSAGKVWVVNHTNPGSISEFNSNGTAITGSSGYTGWTAGTSTLNNPAALAIDGVGNLWVTNGGNNSITEFIGLASPVVTPIVGNFLNGYTHAASKP